MKRPSSFSVVIGSIVLAGVFASVASAWTGPTASAPNNNVAAPINTSASGQVKTGDFATLGKVGIGTPSPNANFKLNIEGAATPWTAYFHNNVGGIYLGPGNSLWSHIYTDNPMQPFIFNANITSISGTFTSYNGDLTLGTNFSATSTTPRVTVQQASGNVGIGTTNPTSRLEVAYSAGPTIQLYNDGASSAGLKGTLWFTHKRASDGTREALAYIQAVAEDNQSAGGLRFVSRNNADVEVMRTTKYGGLVIGSPTPYGSAKLTVESLNNGTWAQIVNYNNGAPSGQYGIYAYGSVYAMYGSGPIYATSFLYASDARWKHNVKNLDQGILTLMKLRPVSFTWNADAPDDHKNKDDIGFIAQEMEAVVPSVVMTDPKTGYKEIDYPRLMPILVQAIQDQQKEIDTLTTRIEALEAKLK